MLYLSVATDGIVVNIFDKHEKMWTCIHHHPYNHNHFNHFYHHHLPRKMVLAMFTSKLCKKLSELGNVFTHPALDNWLMHDLFGDLILHPYHYHS